MGFLQPLALLGLAAAVIPALLHLLERRQPPVLEFPAVRYLTETERQHARRLRLRHLLLLILRTTLVVAVVLAAARPVVRGAAAVGAGHEPTAVAIVLDNSLSSGAVSDGVAVLDRLAATARETVREATASDRLWLVLADGVVRRAGRDEILAVLERLDPAPIRLDLSGAVEAAARAIADQPLPREVHVLSDLQATALGRARVPSGVRVLVEGPGRRPANRGIDTAQVRDGALAVALGGTPDAAPGEFRVTVAGREAGRGLAAPGTSAAIPLRETGDGARGIGAWRVGAVELEPDELLGDNRRAFVWRVLPPARARAEPSAGAFVAVALEVLRDAGRVVAGAEVVIADRPTPGASVVVPPADPALLGQLNRALAARGVRWRYEPAPAAEAGPVVSAVFPRLGGVPVLRRLPLAGGDTSDVLATVAGSPWLVRAATVLLLGSRLEPEWTTLPTSPAFVPFVDELVNRLARGEAPIGSAEGAPAVEFTVSPGGDTLGAVVRGPDPRESDLTPASGDGIQEGLGGRVTLVAGMGWRAERFGGARRAELTGALLLLALLLAAAEWGVATLTR